MPVRRIANEGGSLVGHPLRLISALDSIDGGRCLEHQLELGHHRPLHCTRQIAKVFEKTLGGILLVVQLPGRDLVLDRAAEKLGLCQSIDSEHSLAQLGMRTNPASARILLGRVALARKEFGQADQLARAAVEDELYRIPAAVLLAQALNGQNRPAVALAIAEKTAGEIEARSYEPVLLLDFARGDALARLNRLSEATDAFQREIRHFPRGRQAYANLTVIYVLEGKMNEARRTMETLVTASPGAESYRIAAETFEELGARDEAARWRQRGMR